MDSAATRVILGAVARPHPGPPDRSAREHLASVLVPSSVEKSLKRFSEADLARIRASLARLPADPLCGKPLKGPLAGKRALRAGRAIRIVYEFMSATRTAHVLDVALRRDVY